MIKVGEIRSAHGIQGWVKLYSYTDPRQNLFDYLPWAVFLRGKPIELTLDGWREQGSGIVVKFDQIKDRNQAEALLGAQIFITEEQMPKAKQGEYYTADLMGFEVINLDDEKLGVVCGFFDTAAHTILEVGVQIDSNPKHAIPWHDSVVTSIDTELKRVLVDWPAEL